MKLIKSSVEILNQGYSKIDIEKHIEKCGRVCYKSEDKITEDSYISFLNKIKNLQHLSVFEHGTIYLKISEENDSSSKEAFEINKIINFYHNNNYTKTNIVKITNFDIDRRTYYFSTNFRVLIENNRINDLKYLYEPTEYHHKRISVKFICDRGVSHELVRHRKFSFSQESTRYCNYSKDKFGNELTFIIPSHINNLKEGRYRLIEDSNCLFEDFKVFVGVNEENYIKLIKEDSLFLKLLETSSDNYKELLDLGWTSQQARSVLPNSLKTEVVMTGLLEDWEYFLKLRCDKSAHPDIRKLAIELKEKLVINKLIKN